MLYTNLHHIESASQLKQAITESEYLVIICGRMGSRSIPVYRIANLLEDEYPRVKFFDMEYDNPESEMICQLAANHQHHDIPVIAYYKSGKLAAITSGTQTKEQIKTMLDEHFNN